MNTRPAADFLAAGNAGLDRGDWTSAKAAFESALGLAETAEALEGLGHALWWLNDLHPAIELWERAYAEFRGRGELCSAGRVATRLGREYFTFHGNVAAASGWLQRAEHLLHNAARCPGLGWLTLIRAFMAQDPAVVQLLAKEAMELAKSLGDTDLEIVGLSALGKGLVYGESVRQGMACLDEAMAAATGGEIRSMLAISDIYCNTLLAAPLFVLLVDAQLAEGDTTGAGASAEQLRQLAARSGQQWLAAEAAMAAGRVGAARKDAGAVADLERALDLFTNLELPWEAARARLAVARTRSSSEPEIAVAEARLAFSAFERLGACRDADQAAAVLRELGAGTPPGPRGFGTLTRREAEVLDLVGGGLSNADISARLSISVRTVEHHVGRILAKLNLKTRAQLVAYAARRATE